MMFVTSSMLVVRIARVGYHLATSSVPIGS